MAAYSFVPTPVSRYAHAKIPRGRISPLEPQTPISRYIGRTASDETPVVTAAMSRTASGRWRAVNIMRSAPTKGDQVMSDRTGSVIGARAASPGHSVGGVPWVRRGSVRRIPTASASSRPPLRPDEEQQHAERDAVDVVLRVPALDPP